MSENQRPPFDVVDRLIDHWCERREYGALATLLPAYTAFNGLTDGWVDLYQALRSTKAYAHGRLPEVEERDLDEAAKIAADALRASGTNVEHL
jgi:hypothetical protein